MMDKDEFALAMYLVNLKLEGHSLPAELPLQEARFVTSARADPALHLDVEVVSEQPVQKVQSRRRALGEEVVAMQPDRQVRLLAPEEAWDRQDPVEVAARAQRVGHQLLP